MIQFNDSNDEGIEPFPRWLEDDIKIIQSSTSIRFFNYAPRMWMVGCDIEPLEMLLSVTDRSVIIEEIIDRFPDIIFAKHAELYRLRVAPIQPDSLQEYDSPPNSRTRFNRLDSSRLSVLYASQDIQICIHECRVTAEDETYLATLRSIVDLKLLNLAEFIDESNVTEFESLNITIQMLFLAGDHSYDICRDIAVAAYSRGYDGIIYPSYFSFLRTGNTPFASSFGISHLLFPQFFDRERSKIVANIALFGHPIADEKVEVLCVNKLLLRNVNYDYSFGPSGV